ncbi:hypothetical protein FGLOB1_1056 [Fusarium globosum]|uniref:Uncharacterized protein n=1 Tax=Fusarium globosum TaxID=78864 RepID=A0A8H6DK05_9HYPO|nr:hypothetical protein FGLOB1_1056 [Fusarium globosum]
MLESTDLYETNEMSGSRGEANFVWKCKNCKRESSASVKAGPFPYEQTEPAKPQKILEFDCRGLEFTEFKAEGEWLAEGLETGTKFTGIDLEEGEWFEYDEKSNEEVSINDVKWEVRRSIEQPYKRHAFELDRGTRLLYNIVINPLSPSCRPQVVRKGSFKRPELQSRIYSNNQKILKPQLSKMAVSELPGTIDFLTDAAHLLRATAPETSAHLMSQRGHLLQQHGVTLSDFQRQHVCGGCGIIMIPGQEATLKLDARKSLQRKKAKSKKPSGNSTLKATEDHQGPCKILHCDNCQRDTRIVMPPPGPAVRRKTAQSKVKKVSTPIEQPKQTSNASSKKRAKNRKAGLQALLSGQKQQTTNPLSLSHFMK